MRTTYISFHKVYEANVGALRIDDHGILSFQKEHLKVHGLQDTVFKCLSIHTLEDEYIYIPGYMTRDFKFYRCPIIAGNIQINKFVILKTSKVQKGREWDRISEDTITLDITCFDKQGTVNEQVVICVKRTGYQIEGHGISYVQNTINFLNKCIQDRGNVSTIDFEKFSYDTFKLPGRHQLLHAISCLKMECFDNSKNNPGKDNSFWSETEVSELPDSPYLRAVFAKILRENCNYLTQTGDKMVLHSEYESAWSPSFSRKKSDGTGCGEHHRAILNYEISSAVSLEAMLYEKLAK